MEEWYLHLRIPQKDYNLISIVSPRGLYSSHVLTSQESPLRIGSSFLKVLTPAEASVETHFFFSVKRNA